MTAGQNIYSTCYQCHRQEVDVPEAEPLQRGITLIENLGCHGCHSAIGPAEEHAGVDPRSHGPNRRW